ncbi:RBBP9/YdeN family alpha/beta hydrolase [Salinactinospora qingdaonensis]|uniref:Alpha/beta hydrolase n=1 Tax=Salinactinospora qingdaonensis TaxID=702744 RepID=A0ABP7G1Z2_9ACTN
METTATYVFLAGIGNSEAHHWQYLWYQRTAGGVWVEHESWDSPDRDRWVKDLDDALAAVTGPKLLVAHSLGCSVVAEWARDHTDTAITGAFLVAMPDVHGPNFPAAAQGFGAPPQERLPFPTVVVASENDPYGSLEHSEAAARQMGAQLVNVGRRGHINAESDLGAWDEGWSIFTDHFVR